MNGKLLKPDSAKKNFVFQFLYQVIILVIPMVVSPYLTRALGGVPLGVYTYTYSIAYYFVIFAMLGINRHGQRIISQRRGDLVELRMTFWSLYCVHFVTSIVALFAYILYVLFLCNNDSDIAFIQAIYVASAVFDLTWLFYGLEKFKMVTIRNAILKVISTACIFIFVRKPSDIGIYTAIMASTACVGHFILIPRVIKEIPPIKFDRTHVIEHFKPLLTLFAAAIAVSLYTVFDKTLLGVMLTKESVAYYEYSDKIVTIPKTFISIIGTVLFPKACQYANIKDYNGMRRNMDITIVVTCFIGFLSCFGLLAIADRFAILYYGEEFAVCGSIISLMAPLILIIGIGEAVRVQYIFPLKMDANMVKILFLNAFINLILSACLIPFYGIGGVIIGTIAAEVTGLILEIFIVRKYLSVRWLLFQCFPFAIIGMFMFVIVKIVETFTEIGWGTVVVQVLVGFVVYCIGSLGYIFFLKKELFNVGLNWIKVKVKKLK